MPINSFSKFLIEEERSVYFTFGRMNPPTIGHGKLLDKLSAAAGKNPVKIFLSQSQDTKSNPLSYSDKVKHTRKMFPKHARNVVVNKSVKTAIDAITDLYNQGFRKVVMVVGADRVNEFNILLNKYNGKEARHGFYNFQEIKVISAGDRDPDAEGVEGMSASKMRQFAKDNDFTMFAQGLPATLQTKDARKLFNDVRSGLGLKEEKSFKNHVALEPVSEIREKFVAGEIFNVGDEVIMKGTDTIATITVRGSNYVVVEYNGNRARRWLNSIELVEQDNKTSMYVDKPDWGTPESTAKAKKMTPAQEGNKPGLWDNIHARRKKGLPPKKPGEKGYPKTLNIEQNDMERAREKIAQDKQQSHDMIAREKQKDKQKHDRILDAARRAVMLRKNRGVKQ